MCKRQIYLSRVASTVTFSLCSLYTFTPLQQIKSAPYKQSESRQSRFRPQFILSLWPRYDVLIPYIPQLPSLCSWPKVVASKCIWNKLTAFSKMRDWGSSAQIHGVIYIFDQSTKAGVLLSSLQSEKPSAVWPSAFLTGFLISAVQ